MRFVFLQNIIDKIRLKEYRQLKHLQKFNNIDIPNHFQHCVNIQGQNNSLTIKKGKSTNNNIIVHVIGNSNKIIIKECKYVRDIVIRIYGDNNNVVIDKNSSITLLSITIGENFPHLGKVQNSSFKIGENASIERMIYKTFNSNTFCNIGNDCLISFDVDLYNTDGHPIYDIETNELINKVKGIEIGNHCWLGANTSILKNSSLPDNSILGWGSVFSGTKYSEPNCVYAGNPAKIVRKNVLWKLDGSKGYVQNE